VALGSSYCSYNQTNHTGPHAANLSYLVHVR